MSSTYTVPQSGIQTALQKYTPAGWLGLWGQQQKVPLPQLRGQNELKSYEHDINAPAQPYFTPQALSTIANRADSQARVGSAQQMKELAARNGGDISSPLYQQQASSIQGNQQADTATRNADLDIENKQLGEKQKQIKLGNEANAFGMENQQQYLYPPLVPGAGGQGAGQALSAALPLILALLK